MNELIKNNLKKQIIKKPWQAWILILITFIVWLFSAGLIGVFSISVGSVTLIILVVLLMTSPGSLLIWSLFKGYKASVILILVCLMAPFMQSINLFFMLITKGEEVNGGVEVVNKLFMMSGGIFIACCIVVYLSVVCLRHPFYNKKK